MADDIVGFAHQGVEFVAADPDEDLVASEDHPLEVSDREKQLIQPEGPLQVTGADGGWCHHTLPFLTGGKQAAL
jgi:hypothetical protein